jgi:hypothetical protein
VLTKGSTKIRCRDSGDRRAQRHEQEGGGGNGHDASDQDERVATRSREQRRAGERQQQDGNRPSPVSRGQIAERDAEVVQHRAHRTEARTASAHADVETIP